MTGGTSSEQKLQDVAQFWAGWADDADTFYQLFSDDIYYALDDDARDETPLDAFAHSQGERWYDHDFLETGFEAEDKLLAIRFAHHSGGDVWGPAFAEKVQHMGIGGVNCLIMMGLDKTAITQFGHSGRQIERPTHIDLPGVRMFYLGELDT